MNGTGRYAVFHDMLRHSGKQELRSLMVVVSHHGLVFHGRDGSHAISRNLNSASADWLFNPFVKCSLGFGRSTLRCSLDVKVYFIRKQWKLAFCVITSDRIGLSTT